MGTTPSPPSPPSASSLPPPTPTGPTPLRRKPGTSWAHAWRRCRAAAPDAFTEDGCLRVLRDGTWHDVRGDGHGGGEVRFAISPVDGSAVAAAPSPTEAEVRAAVDAAHEQQRAWSDETPQERRTRVGAAVDALAEYRTLFALLLVWETGAPWQHAQSAVDATLDEVRKPLATGSASVTAATAQQRPQERPVLLDGGAHGDPMPLVRTMLTAALAGDAVLATASAEGGAACVTLACALAARAGAPVTLLGRARIDPGDELHMAEPEFTGPARWGIWEYSEWKTLAPMLRGTFARTGGQRPAGCTQFVVQRAMLDPFLAVYLPAVRAARFGHPLAVAGPQQRVPAHDLGPMASAEAATESTRRLWQAVDDGATLLHQGTLADGEFLPGQDIAAYAAPSVLLFPSAATARLPSLPGPVGCVIAVDSEVELLAALHADGAGSGDSADSTDGQPPFSARLFTGDPGVAQRLTPYVRPGAHGPRGATGAADPADRRPRSAARSPGNTEVNSTPGAWYGYPRRHGNAERQPLSGWRNGRRASLRC